MRGRAFGLLVVTGVLFMAAVVFAILTRPERTVVRDRPVVTTPIVGSPVTPLPEKHDSGPRVRAKSLQRSFGSGGSKQSEPRKVFAKPNRPVSRPRTRPKAHSPARRPNTPERPPEPPQPPSSQPAPRPPVDVTVPAPAGVCVNGLGGVNCP